MVCTRSWGWGRCGERIVEGYRVSVRHLHILKGIVITCLYTYLHNPWHFSTLLPLLRWSNSPYIGNTYVFPLQWKFSPWHVFLVYVFRKIPCWMWHVSEYSTPLFYILPNSQGCLICLKMSFYNLRNRSYVSPCLYSVTMLDWARGRHVT